MIKEDNVIQRKSYSFAIRIMKLVRVFHNKKEFILSNQLLRSGTSIGANVEEAIGGQTKKDFIAKVSIAYKESRETKYWVRILHDTEMINNKEYLSLLDDLDQIQKLLVSILKTAKHNLDDR